jgi:dTDP-glucose 4,6-dehydratase
MNVLVTGGAGFIGSNLLQILVPSYPQHNFLNLDKLGYAGNLRSLEAIESCGNYSFRQVDLVEHVATQQTVESFSPDLVIHLAAETHVDRSIHGPRAFIESNIVGTFNLLEACRELWAGDTTKRFHHVSTDEVYGSLGDEGFFTEETAYDPSSPYSASKAASDHLVRAYSRTYGLNVTVTNCSNNYGPRQFPEKLIPLMILNCLDRKPLPIYGEGLNVRDWLYVDDHCRAIWKVATEAEPGATYNIGGNVERTNKEMVQAICEVTARKLGVDVAELTGLITRVADRPGHDHRYAIDASKVKRELGWEPTETLESGLEKTVDWYLANEDWITSVRDGSYRNWLAQNYASR